MLKHSCVWGSVETYTLFSQLFLCFQLGTSHDWENRDESIGRSFIIFVLSTRTCYCEFTRQNSKVTTVKQFFFFSPSHLHKPFGARPFFASLPPTALSLRSGRPDPAPQSLPLSFQIKITPTPGALCPPPPHIDLAVVLDVLMSE